MEKADQLNKQTGVKRFGVYVVGGLDEVFVVDNEKIGTFGDLFEAGPTELNRCNLQIQRKMHQKITK